MRSAIKNVSLVILLFKMCIVLGQEVIPQKRIVIDPGHGGKDSGAIGANGIQEKDVVLNIAKEIVRLNRTLLKNELDIYLTRYQDTLISLSDRTKLAWSLKADVFISLHCNHSDNPEARGVEVYVSKKYSKYSKESVYLAFKVQNGFKEALGFKSRGVKFGDFQLLRETRDDFPSVLLELGFLSNVEEERYIQKITSTQSISLIILKSCWTGKGTIE